MQVENATRLLAGNYFRALFTTSYSFKRQPHKMIKHTQTIHRQFAKELLSVWPFCGIGAQRVNAIDLTIVILRNFVLKHQNNTNNWVQLQ